MPTLPGYENKRNINANIAEPLRNEASIPYENQQKVIGAIQQVTQQWSNANDLMQYTEARAKYGVAVSDIESRAYDDPDFRNSEKYLKEIDEAKKLSLSGISNQEVAGKANIEFAQESAVTGFKIGNQFRKKQLEYNKVMVKTDLDTIMQRKLNSATEAESQTYDLQIIELIEQQAQAGILSYAEADKLLKDSQETAVKYEIYNDSSTQEKDSAILKDLKKHDGKYSFLDPDTRLQMIEESQRRIFQNNQTFKRETEVARDDRFNDIFTKANEGTLTLNDLDKEMAIPEEAGGIPKKQLLDIRKSMQTRIKTDLEAVSKSNKDSREYISFVNTFISDETDRQKGREAIVQAFKDGILSPKEAALLNKLKRETEGIKDLRSREEFMGNNIVPFKNAINSVNDFFTGKKNFTESEKALSIKRLLSGSAEGGDPQEISQQIIKDVTIQKNPNILNFAPEGQIVADENGYLKIMNNKGEVKEHTSKPASSPAKKPASKEKK